MRLIWCSLLLSLIAGCGASSARESTSSHDVELRTLSENRALTMIDEVLQDSGVPFASGWSIALHGDDGRGVELAVDRRLAASAFGIEWLSAQDRIDHPELPGPTDSGQLRIAPGAGDDASAQVLLLEHTSYEFANERVHVQRGTPGAGDTEGRLRRDVRDYLHYVRGEGGL